jgi:putative chitinase
MITIEQLKKISGKAQHKIDFDGILAGLEIALPEAEVNSTLRLSHFLSQILTETGNWHWFAEIGSDAYLKKYDGRVDLGNVHKGDGPRYKGRGWLMLTGRANYTKAAKALGLDLVEHPELASLPEPAGV